MLINHSITKTSNKTKNATMVHFKGEMNYFGALWGWDLVK